MQYLYGTQAARTAVAYPSIDVNDAEDVLLENVSIAYCLFETPVATAIPLLPTGVHPSVPSLVMCTFWSVPGGPLGAFEFASVGISCRTGIKPRQLIYGAFIDNQAAGAALGRRYGYACQPATVKLREFYDRISGSVIVNDRALLQVDTTGMVPLVGAGSFVKFSPTLNFAVSNNQLHMAQLEASYEFVRVIRGIPRISAFDAPALGDSALSPQHPVSGAFAIVNLTLHPAKFLVSATLAAEAGGVTRIERSVRECA